MNKNVDFFIETYRGFIHLFWPIYTRRGHEERAVELNKYYGYK